MADQYDMYAGGAPTTAEKQAALAQMLRQQALLGKVGMATGDRVLSPTGHALYNEADSAGKSTMSDREHQASLEEALQAHQDSMAQSAAHQAQAMTIAKMQDARMREIAAGNQQTRRDIADAKGDDKPKKPIPPAAAKDMESFLDSARGVDAALESLRTLDANGIDTGGLFRETKNSLAQTVPGLASPEQQAVQNWHANYGRQFTLPELKATIGIRHNQYMQNLFESYHIAPNMSNKQKLENLEQISKQLHDRISTRAKDYASQGYEVGDYSEQPAGAPAPMPGSRPGTAAGAAPNARPGDKYLVPGAPAAPAAPPMGALPLARPKQMVSPFMQQQPGNLFTGGM